jgi:cytoskeletal protein RodZ
MAASIGQRLREARTEQGVELSDVERATKIRVKFLLAMEQDQWEELPAPAYARGFLQSYARFLGLDEQALVDQYKRTVEAEQHAEPIPSTVIRPGTLPPSPVRRRRPLALIGAGAVAVLVLGVVVAGSLGGSDGGDGSDRSERKTSGEDASRTDQSSGPSTATPSTTTGSEVSLELRARDLVWVCVVDERDEPVVNSETLSANESRGPFARRRFDLNLGNGSIAISVDGEAVDVPALAEPLGYRVTPEGVRELAPSERPTCA